MTKEHQNPRQSKKPEKKPLKNHQKKLKKKQKRKPLETKKPVNRQKKKKLEKKQPIYHRRKKKMEKKSTLTTIRPNSLSFSICEGSIRQFNLSTQESYLLTNVTYSWTNKMPALRSYSARSKIKEIRTFSNGRRSIQNRLEERAASKDNSSNGKSSTIKSRFDKNNTSLSKAASLLLLMTVGAGIAFKVRRSWNLGGETPLVFVGRGNIKTDAESWLCDG